MTLTRSSAPTTAPAPAPDYETFSRVIGEAKRATAGQGGQLVFVYVPTYEELGLGDTKLTGESAEQKSHVVQVVQSLGIDVLDLEPVFKGAGDARSFFPFGMGGHYSAKGYEVEAGAILGYLKQLGLGRTGE